MSRRFISASTDRVDCGTFSIVEPEITITCRVFWDSFPVVDDRLVSKANGTGAASHDWLLAKRNVSGDEKLRFRCNRQTTTLAGNTPLTTGVWHHCAARYSGIDPASPVGELYLDGVSDSAETAWAGSGGNLPDNTNSVIIGNQPIALAHAPDGIIDDVTIWSSYLSSDELFRLAHGIVRPEDVRPNTIQLRMTLLGKGLHEIDRSVYGRHATVVGATSVGEFDKFRPRQGRLRRVSRRDAFGLSSAAADIPTGLNGKLSKALNTHYGNGAGAEQDVTTLLNRLIEDLRAGTVSYVTSPKLTDGNAVFNEIVKDVADGDIDAS